MAIQISKGVDGDGVCTISVAGEIDLYSSTNLRAEITEAASSATKGINIDLKSVEYMDSSGVATLVEGLRAAMERKIEFVLVGLSPSVLKVLQLSRLDTVFTIRD